MDECNLILLRTESLYLMPQIFGGNIRFSVCKSIKKLNHFSGKSM